MHPVPHVLVRAMAHRGSRSYYRPRAMSLENPQLLEALTIYEKLKKCQEENEQEFETESDDHNIPHDIFPPNSMNGPGDFKFQTEEEPLPLESFTPDFSQASDEIKEFSAYSKYRDINLTDTNYLYFSASTGLVQSETLEGLCEEENEMDYTELLISKKYWLDVVNPTEKDLALLSSVFKVHDLTLRDIREGNTEEKMELFSHYSFISLKLLKDGKDKEQQHAKGGSVRSNSSNDATQKAQSIKYPFGNILRQHKKYGEEKCEESECLNIDIDQDTDTTGLSSVTSSQYPDLTLPCFSDYIETDVDLNILLFSEFVITIHRNPWESVKEVLGFLSILFEYGGQTPPMPEWVLFSIFVELCEEAKKGVRKLTPKILSMRAAQVKREGEAAVNFRMLSSVLRENLKDEFDLHRIYRFVKPKLQVLRAIQLKGRRRFPNVPGVVRFLANVGAEFDEMLDELDNLSRVVERCLDTYLALASVQQSVEANEMGEIMKRISEIAMIFLPVQAVSGFLGMNVKVPFQEADSTFPFWTVVICSLIVAASLFLGKRLILCRPQCSKYFNLRKLGLKRE